METLLIFILCVAVFGVQGFFGLAILVAVLTPLFLIWEAYQDAHGWLPRSMRPKKERKLPWRKG